jgi:hypothetical protein
MSPLVLVRNFVPEDQNLCRGAGTTAQTKYLNETEARGPTYPGLTALRGQKTTEAPSIAVGAGYFWLL